MTLREWGDVIPQPTFNGLGKRYDRGAPLNVPVKIRVVFVDSS